MIRPASASAPETYVLVAPTASGKTAVAQRLAEEDDYDILSTDSMLVYRGMDIGTAKPSPDERQGVTYYGIDLVEPDHDFCLADYVAHAREVLARAARDGRRLILVGGTGLYVQVLVSGFDDLPTPCPQRRKELEQLRQEGGVPALVARLKALAPAFLDQLADPANPRRLIRAIESAEAGVTSLPSSWRRRPKPPPVTGLKISPDVLNSRIERRVRHMYDHGILNELRELRLRFDGLSRTASQAIGYAEAGRVLDGELDQESAIQQTAARTRRLAKRQRTWFRHQADVHEVVVNDSSTVEEMADAVRRQWQQHGPVPLTL